MIFGRNLLVTIKENIGDSSATSSIGDEVEKMTWTPRWGGDPVTNSRNIHETRAWI